MYKTSSSSLPTPALMRKLMIVKLSLAGLVALLLLLGRDSFYPLAQWPMFSNAGWNPPGEAFTVYTVQFIDETGTTYPVDTRVFNFHVDPTVFAIIQDAPRSAEAAIGRQQVATALVEKYDRFDIVEAQLWQATWQADYTQSPPLVYCEPAQTELIARIPIDAPTADPLLTTTDTSTQLGDRWHYCEHSTARWTIGFFRQSDTPQDD